MGELTSDPEVQFYDIEIGVLEDRRDHQTAHPVGGVDHNLKGPGEAQEPQDVLPVLVPQVHRPDLPGRGGLWHAAQGAGHVLYLLEARVLSDGAGLKPGDLESVVFDWIVRGGHLDPAARAQMVYGEVHHRRVAHPDVNAPAPGCGNPADRRVGKWGAVGSHVAPDKHAVRRGLASVVTAKQTPQELGGCVPDLPGEILVNLIAIDSPHVVGFEYSVDHGHRGVLSPC